MDNSSLVLTVTQNALRGYNFPKLRIAVLAHECDLDIAEKLVSLFRRSDILCWTEEQLLPGQDWVLETARAYREADFILVMLSARSTELEGIYQKNIRTAREAGSVKPDSGIKTIPVHLDECETPFILRDLYRVDLWEKSAMIRLVLAWATEWQRRTEANDWPTTVYKSAWK